MKFKLLIRQVLAHLPMKNFISIVGSALIKVVKILRKQGFISRMIILKSVMNLQGIPSMSQSIPQPIFHGKILHSVLEKPLSSIAMTHFAAPRLTKTAVITACLPKMNAPLPIFKSNYQAKH